MPLLFSIPTNPVLAAYILAFGGAAVICVVSLSRTSAINDDETGRGLQALLLTSGAWAIAHVLFLVVPTLQLKLAFYQLGLAAGLSSVGAWLYFCSAYTGRTLHRAPAIRRLAIGLFLAILLVKLTNPLHGLYFRTEVVTTPFPHLAVHSQPLHWLVMGLAYALALVGYFMLFELFWQVGHETTPLVGLVGLTGLPLILDVIGTTTSQLIGITYEPLGVAAFAVGVLFLYLGHFQTIQLTGHHDAPVIVLDDDGRVRDFNTDVTSLFPALAPGEDIATVAPEIAEHLDTDGTVIDFEQDGQRRYYQVSSHSYRTDKSRRGQTITLTDITDREQYRRGLERQNERLDQFASVVSHDLRNPLHVAQLNLELAQETCSSEYLDSVATAHQRMDSLIEDLLSLARQREEVHDTEAVDLAEAARRCWANVPTADATLVTETAQTIRADETRLCQLLENLLRNAVEHGSESVSVTIGDLEDGFYVADDGPGIPAEEREQVFDTGYSTTDDGTGFGLKIVSEIADAHNWEVSVSDSEDGGARFEITSVTRVQGGGNGGDLRAV